MKLIFIFLTGLMISCADGRIEAININQAEASVWQRQFLFDYSIVTLVEDFEGKISTDGTQYIRSKNCDNTLTEINIEFSKVPNLGGRLYFLRTVRPNQFSSYLKNLKDKLCQPLATEDHFVIYNLQRHGEDTPLNIQIQIYNSSLKLIRTIEEESI